MFINVYSSYILVPGDRSGFEKLWQASTSFCYCAESAATNSLRACGAVKPQIELGWLGTKVQHTTCIYLHDIAKGRQWQ